MSSISHMLGTRSEIERKIAAVLRRLGLYALVHAIYGRLFKRSRGGNSQAHGAAFRPTKLEQLTPEARKIYAELKAAIEQRKREGC